VTLKVSSFTVAVWAKGDLVYRHQRVPQKGDHQYITEHYLELLTSKPRSIANATPLRKGVMPKELKGFLGLCKARDKEQQLLEIVLFGRSVDLLVPLFMRISFILEIMDKDYLVISLL
jgi:hypothetical protein